MADVENNKPKTEKTSASVTSTLPRPCPTTNLYSKDIDFNTQEIIKSPSQRNRPTSDEIKKRPDFIDSTKTNLHKSKLTEFKNSERVRIKNVSLTLISPRDYHGLIPIPNRHSSYPVGMSPPVTRSPSPLKKNSPKELKSSNKIKTITLEQDVKKKSKTTMSRSPSPAKRAPGSYKKTNAGSLTSAIMKNPEKTSAIKRADGGNQSMSPRTSSPSKRKPKAKVSSSSNVEVLNKDKLKKDSERSGSLGDAVVLKQTSQPALCKKEKILQPQEKISLDHLKSEVYSGDHKRLSSEKLHLCIEKSLDNGNLVESKRSYLVTYLSDDMKNQEEISLSFLQNITSKSITNMTKETFKSEESKDAIRTLSGHELIITPSIKLEMEREIDCDDIEISELLHESVKNFEDQKDVHILQDDTNEYDSEVSTDGETRDLSDTSAVRVASDASSKKMSQSAWKSPETELLHDVDYRQSVYHPAVSRRHNDDRSMIDCRPKSKSIEDNYANGDKIKDKIVRSSSSQFKSKYMSQNFSLDQEDRCNKRSWGSSFDKTESIPIYKTGGIQEIQIYDTISGVERIRTKKQRLSGALLRFTLKIIRLLALFNAWPGDYCHMLSSQSLRLAT